MKTNFYVLLFCSLHLAAQSQNQQKTQAINWQNFSTSSVLYTVINYASKPLQYNDELDLITFIQRASPYYPTTPTPTPNAANGVIVGMISSNWGTTWDSTCIWSNDNYWGRYPQGGVYNPPGNTTISNAYMLGTGACLSAAASNWSGNWAASKPMGTANYNTTASTLANAQQYFSCTPPLPPFGNFYFARNSFSSCDDGKMFSLAQIGNPANGSDIRGAMVLKANFNAGVFNWTGDSIICYSAYNTFFDKVITGEQLMAWNESGTTGYVVFFGSRFGSVGSNVGIQPIVYRSINSGITWELMPAMDFNSAGAFGLKKFLPKVMPNNPDPNLIIPNAEAREGWDAVVDKNNALHVVCVLNGATYSSRDSLFNRRNYGSANYNWPHTPGKRPYLVDFMLQSNKDWTYGIVDSLSSEMPGSTQQEPGWVSNPWGTSSPNGITNQSRVECSRTPDGRFVIITWAESDTISNAGWKWNMNPDIKARLIDANTYGLSPTEINISAGTNTNVNQRATFHCVAPRSGTVTLSANTFDVKLPVTITNNPNFSQLATVTHWFSAAELSFSNLTVPFTQTISLAGITEAKLISENDFIVYPNPFSSSFKIRNNSQMSSSYNISLYDISGRKLFSKNVSGTECELDASALSTGAYFLEISNDKTVIHKKILKD